jgi:hypothetical protein
MGTGAGSKTLQEVLDMRRGCAHCCCKPSGRSNDQAQARGQSFLVEQAVSSTYTHGRGAEADEAQVGWTSHYKHGQHALGFRFETRRARVLLPCLLRSWRAVLTFRRSSCLQLLRAARFLFLVLFWCPGPVGACGSVRTHNACCLFAAGYRRVLRLLKRSFSLRRSVPV